MTKILFTHNTAMWYRIPFFKKIAENYDLDLVFTHMNVIKEVYDENEDIGGLESVNYTILRNSFGFCRGLFSKALHDYDVVVGGSWDTPQELIESILLFVIIKIKREPFIIWREDWDWDRKDSLKEKLLTTVIRYLCKHSDAILVPGSLHKEYFQNKIGVDEENIIIMPNVSNISEDNAQLNKNDEIKRILYVGRLIKRKGVNYLLEAYSKLQKKMSNTQLIIVGSGNEENNLKRYVQKNNLESVLFTGKVDNDKLKEYYSLSNIVVVPSVNEGMGDPWVFVLNEAMHYGKPIIATDVVGASKDMIKDNGFIVSEKNSDELYEAMLKILSNDELEKSMSIKSKEIISNYYQYENMINSFNNAIKKVKKEK